MAFKPAVSLAIVCAAFATLGLLFTTPNAAPGGEPYTERTGVLPTSADLERWLGTAKEIERELQKGDPRISLQMKKAHVYPKVLKGDEVIGRFRPEATSSSVRAEITTFNIARGLGCGELFQPAVEIELRGKGLATFRRMLETTAFPEHKEEERRELLLAIENYPESLSGAYKPMPPAEAMKYRGAERPDDPPNGGLDTSDVIAKYLRHDSPQPGRELIALPHTGLRGSPAHLARQLSDIMLVDALAGQWDRFSGNNLHIVPTTDGARLMAIDNGGADPTDDQGYLDKFCHWVTRFDEPVVEHLWALDAFLKKHGRFRGFTDEQALETALGFEDPKEWKSFKERVHLVAAHTRAIKGERFFEK